ncbi:MAG TPA: M13 family metallopeptidase N-terminal domain-containing protein, partial [Gemmatimonadales bacterium]|nr:M13 family metallopeptidase N-terminal domain-containing protein [Gemmatimonadales bacterium]
MNRICRHPLGSLVTLALLATPLAAWAQSDHTASSVGIDLAGMDRSVKPGDDFFAYANGTWIKQTDIPPDKSSYGAGGILADSTDRQVADLIQTMARSSSGTAEQEKIGDYYAAFMDTTAIDAAGLKPLQPTLDSIEAIQDRKGLASFLGTTIRADVDALNATNF